MMKNSSIGYALEMSVRTTMANSLVVLKKSKIKQTISTVNMAIRLQYLWFCVVQNTVDIAST